jgi:hypothetical protein
MPTYYFKGSSPDYLGEAFTTSQGLLQGIRDNLVLCGWTTITDTSTGATGSILMRGVTTVNAHNCWIKFTTTVVSGSQERLTIRGDQTGANTTLSIDATITMDYVSGSTNYYYLTADNEAGCLVIRPNSLYSFRAAHFGFLDRVETSDQYAWMVGHIYGKDYSLAFVAKGKYDSQNWKCLSEDYVSSTNTATNQQSFAPQGIFDRYTVCHKPANDYETTAVSYSNDNPGYRAYLGKLNYNGLPILDNFFYIEGKDLAAQSGLYGATTFSLYYRGDVKFACTGVASLPGGSQCITTNGERYISGGDPGWQGFRIG